MKCPGKTLQAVLMCRMFLLVGRRGWTAVRVMQAKLGE
jgi:hypothetical protein